MRRLFALGGAQYLLLATQFVTGPLIARALGPADRGLLAIILILFAFLPALVGLGASALFRAMVSLGSATETAYRQLRKQTIVGAGISIPFALLVALFLPPTVSLGERIAVGAMIGVSALISYRNAILSGAIAARELKLISRNSYLQGALTLGSTVILFATGTLSLTTVCLTYLIVSVLTFLPTLRPLSWEQKNTKVSPGMRYAIGSLPGQLGEVLILRIDQVLVAGILGLYAAGIYSVAWSYAFMLYPLAHTIAVWKASEAGTASPRTGFFRTQRYWGISAIVAIAVVMAVLSDSVIHLLFGEDYALSGELAPIILISMVLMGFIIIETQRNLSEAKAVRTSVALLSGILFMCVIAVPVGNFGLFAMPWISVLGTACVLSILKVWRFIANNLEK